MTCLILPYKFKPRYYQKELNHAFFVENKKRLIQILHRRGGKSKNAINLLLGAAFRRVGTYYHSFPELKQAKKVIWQGIDKEGMRYLDHIPKQLIKRINNTEMYIELINGSIIQMAGTDRYDSLMGGNPAGIIFDEYPLQNPLAWHYLRPILAENEGWALFIYTPRGKNHGYDIYEQALNDPEWFVQKLSVEDTKDLNGNRIISEEIIEKERKAGMPEELISQEFYCSFDSALVGAYYSKELDRAYKEGRINNFEIDRNIPIHTSWDLGIRDSMSIWFIQIIGHEYRFVHYYENSGYGLDHYIQYLETWQRENRTRFGQHFGPHDIKNRELTTGKSRLEMAFKMGIQFTPAPMLGIQDGIDSVRMNFVKFRFHETNCYHGINALKEYCKGQDEKPIHNWASHGADALRTFMVGWYDFMNEEIKNDWLEDFD